MRRRVLASVGGQRPSSLYQGVELAASRWFNPPTLEGNTMRGLGLIDHPFDPADSAWEMCVSFKKIASQYGIGNVVGFSGKGTDNSPFVLQDGAGGGNTFQARFNSISTGALNCSFSPKFADGESGIVKFGFDGVDTYYIDRLVSGEFVRKSQKVQTGHLVIEDTERIRLCYHSNTGYQFNGEIYLDKCFITIGDLVWWEGVKGAYERVSQLGGGV